MHLHPLAGLDVPILQLWLALWDGKGCFFAAKTVFHRGFLRCYRAASPTVSSNYVI